MLYLLCMKKKCLLLTSLAKTILGHSILIISTSRISLSLIILFLKIFTTDFQDTRITDMEVAMPYTISTGDCCYIIFIFLFQSSLHSRFIRFYFLCYVHTFICLPSQLWSFLGLVGIAISICMCNMSKAVLVPWWRSIRLCSSSHSHGS